MTPLHGIACFYDVGFGARAVSRKTSIYFIESVPREISIPSNPLIALDKESMAAYIYMKVGKACKCCDTAMQYFQKILLLS